MRARLVTSLLGLLVATSALAQQPATPAGGTPGVDPSPAKPRVFVTESDSWQSTGRSGGSFGAFGASSSGGARPQTAEVIKTIGQRCPDVVGNNRLEMTDYVLRLEHEGGKGLLRHKDKVAVFVRKSGDAIFSESTLSVGGAVQGACEAILADWAAHARQIAALPEPGTNPIASAPTVPAAVAPAANLTIDSNVPNSDIEVDGTFVGNTPSTVSVAPGQHTVVIKKKGYADWSRTLSVAGPSIRLSADLEQSTATR